MNIEELENLRKKARNNALIVTLITIIVGVVLFVIFGSPFMFIFTIVIGVFITSMVNNKHIKRFTLAFKETFVLKSLKSVFSDLIYEPEKGLDESIIGNTGMMYMGDRYSSNDYISGKYKNINVVQADVHIEEEHETTDSEGNTTTTWITIV